jgi:hypothetical protein
MINLERLRYFDKWNFKLYTKQLAVHDTPEGIFCSKLSNTPHFTFNLEYIQHI